MPEQPPKSRGSRRGEKTLIFGINLAVASLLAGRCYLLRDSDGGRVVDTVGGVLTGLPVGALISFPILALLFPSDKEGLVCSAASAGHCSGRRAGMAGGGVAANDHQWSPECGVSGPR